MTVINCHTTLRDSTTWLYCLPRTEVLIDWCIYINNHVNIGDVDESRCYEWLCHSWLSCGVSHNHLCIVVVVVVVVYLVVAVIELYVDIHKCRVHSINIMWEDLCPGTPCRLKWEDLCPGTPCRSKWEDLGPVNALTIQIR